MGAPIKGVQQNTGEFIWTSERLFWNYLLFVKHELKGLFKFKGTKFGTTNQFPPPRQRRDRHP